MEKIFSDMIINIVATSIPTVVLQLLILPSLSNYMDGNAYGLMVTILAILNVVPSTIGNILNNVRLLHEESYKKDSEQGDFQILLTIFQAINLLIMVMVSIYCLGTKDIIGILLLIAVGILWLGREYHIVAFRLKTDYIAILVNNLCLTTGYGIGYIFFMKNGYWQIIYLLGYILSYLHIVIASPIIKEPFTKTKRLRIVFNDFAFLLISSVLARTINYADKLLLYPILGGTMVSVYYAATVFSKVISLAITPINSVALSYLSKINKKTNSLFKWTYIVGIVVCGIGYIMIVILSRPVLSTLYPKYVDAAMQYIWVTSGTIVVSVLTSMITPFVLRFSDIKWQIWINGITTIVYIIISLSLLKLGGLMGFCVGALLANIIKLLITTYVYLKKQVEIQNK